MAPTVTIDGPSGVGKTAVARALAGALGWRWLSAGLLYRALAADDQPEADLRVEFVEAADGISDPVVAVGTRRHREPELQRPDIASRASRLAQDPAVRTRAQKALRRVADGGLVLEGRSMARTVPDAALHVYLWADRRARQARAAAIGQRLDDQRDAADQGRAHEPLRVQAGMTPDFGRCPRGVPARLGHRHALLRLLHRCGGRLGLTRLHVVFVVELERVGATSATGR